MIKLSICLHTVCPWWRRSDSPSDGTVPRDQGTLGERRLVQEACETLEAMCEGLSHAHAPGHDISSTVVDRSGDECLVGKEWGARSLRA